MATASQLKDQFNESTASYLDWLKSRNVDISPKITIHDYTSINQGRGVIALQDIKEGEVLATIPKSALINVKQNLLVTNFPNLKHYLMRLSHWDALIIILIYELRNRGQSQWLEYINVLPQSGFNQLMFWSTNELNLLQPSCVLDRVGQEAADEMYHKMLETVDDLKINGFENVSFEEYNVVATIIMSYSFDVELTKEETKGVRDQLGVVDDDGDGGDDEEGEVSGGDGDGDEVSELVHHEHGGAHNGTAEVKSLLERNGIPLDEDEEPILHGEVEESEHEQEDEEGDEHEEDESEEEEESDDETGSGSPEILSDGYIKSMVPLADTLNADTTYNNAIINYETDSLVITSIKPIAKGDQIYNTYSNHPNGEILRRYGYIEPHGSKGDFGEVPISIIYQFFIERYNTDEIELSHLLQVVGEVSFIEQQEAMEEEEDEENTGFELVLDSYDCFCTGEVTIELVFLVQLLTTYLTIRQSKDDAEREEITHDSIKRAYHKIYQLIESKKVTSDLIKNLQEILQIRLDQYPNYASDSLTNEAESPSVSMTRDAMAKIVLQSEFHSLKACQEDVKKTLEKTLESPVKVIGDEKLVRAITKADDKGHIKGEKRGGDNDEGDVKRPKKSKK